MDLTAQIINKQIRATIVPLLRERGFSKAATTVSFAHPNADVVHRFLIERFSNYHREVMSFPKFTMSATLSTYYPRELLEPPEGPKLAVAKYVTDDGQLRISGKVAMSGFSQDLIKSIDQPEGVPDGDKRLRHGNWLMLEQSPEYSQILIDDIALQLANEFDTYHAPLGDLRGSLDALLGGDPGIYLGPTRRLDASGSEIECDADALEFTRLRRIVSIATALGEDDLALEHVQKRRTLSSEIRERDSE